MRIEVENYMEKSGNRRFDEVKLCVAENWNIV